VANRATINILACDVQGDGAEAAAAGERAAFRVIAREQGGTRIHHGGAFLSVGGLDCQ
jgi:hypothetical protein